MPVITVTLTRDQVELIQRALNMLDSQAIARLPHAGTAERDYLHKQMALTLLTSDDLTFARPAVRS